MMRRRGLILPVVLVLIGLLAMTVGGFIFFIRAETAGAMAHSDGQQIRLAAESGLEHIVAILRANRHNPRAWFDVPDQLRHILVYSPAYTREGDPVRQQGSRAEAFKRGPVLPAWRVSIVAESVNGLDDTMRFGITPEAGKLNLNTAGVEQITQLLTPLLVDLGVENAAEIVSAVLDWLDPDSELREGGAEDAYYNTLTPAYRAKNGPLDTIEELLLVKGFNARLLYGEDTNRNGILDPNENDGDASPPKFDNRDGNLDRGLAPFVTTWSREPDTAFDNKPRINLNLDANMIAAQVAAYVPEGQLSEATVAFIAGLKQQGFNFSQIGSPAELLPAPAEDGADIAPPPTRPESVAGGRRGAGAPPGSQPDQAEKAEEGAEQEDDGQGDQGDDEKEEQGDGKSDRGRSQSRNDRGGSKGADPQKSDDPPKGEDPQAEEEQEGAAGKDESMGEEPAGEDDGQSKDGSPTGPGGPRTPGQPGGQGADLSALQNSPVTLEELPVLMDRFTVLASAGAEGIFGLININTAPARVLALIPGITPEAIAGILEARARLSPEQLQTTAWPAVSGVVNLTTFHRIAPYITVKAYQYHVEVVGYADHLKMAQRYEWIIEMLGPLAQVKYYRDLTSLGLAWPIDSDQVTVTTQ